MTGATLGGGTVTPGYTVTGLNSGTYGPGFAGFNDYYTLNVGTIGTYTVSISGFSATVILAFVPHSTALPNGVNCNTAVNAPTIHGTANVFPSGVQGATAKNNPVAEIGGVPAGVTAATAVHSPYGKIVVRPTGVNSNAVEHNPYIAIGVLPSGVNADTDTNTPGTGIGAYPEGVNVITNVNPRGGQNNNRLMREGSGT
jgi:hypothetical protein